MAYIATENIMITAIDPLAFLSITNRPNYVLMSLQAPKILTSTNLYTHFVIDVEIYMVRHEDQRTPSYRSVKHQRECKWFEVSKVFRFHSISATFMAIYGR